GSYTRPLTLPFSSPNSKYLRPPNGRSGLYRSRPLACGLTAQACEEPVPSPLISHSVSLRQTALPESGVAVPSFPSRATQLLTSAPFRSYDHTRGAFALARQHPHSQ